jgi:hypothetical protein
MSICAELTTVSRGTVSGGFRLKQLKRNPTSKSGVGFRQSIHRFSIKYREELRNVSQYTLSQYG